MSEAKYTPGPWAVVAPMHAMDGFTHAVVDRHGAALAWALPHGPADGELNARLMAAAPDLLAACELWDKGFVDGEEFDAQRFLKWVNDNRRAARAAIAKARGEA